MRRIASLGGAVVLGLAILGSCKAKELTPPSASGSGSAKDATPIDAAPIDAAAIDAAVAAEPADAAATSTLVIARAGVGALGRFEWWKQDETQTAKLVERGLAGMRGVVIDFDVMDVPGEVETEEGYWSVKRKDELLVQVLRRTQEGDDAPAAVIVWTKEIPTHDGTRVGDPIGAVLAKHPDLTCEHVRDAMIVDLVAADLQCRSPSESEIIYVLSVQGPKIKRGKVAPAKIEKVEIVGIAHVPS